MILKGTKLILRPLTLADAPHFVRWLKDREVKKMNLRRTVSLKEERAWIKKLQNKKNADEVTFAIETIDGVLIGSVGLHVQKKDHHARFGILIGHKDYWGKGYGTEASRLIIMYGFSRRRLHRIYLQVYSYNTRAIALYKKLGFREEGVGRDHIRYDGRYYDEVHMGLLHDEWNI